MSTSERKTGADQSLEIIEEKSSKPDGQTRRYSKGKFLGKGGFAKVYEFTDLQTQKIFASKIIPKASLNKSRAKQKLHTEIKIHKVLAHPHVVKFEHVFEDQDNVYILLEMCPNQTLNELIKRRKRLTELEAACYLIQILNALKFLHENKVIHRDIKLGNLFLAEQMNIKIGDFGLATRLEYDGEKKRTVCGTPNYIAPEILEGKQGHSYEADIWSVGVILYTFLIGKPPFETQDVKATYKRIKMNSYSFPEHVQISQQAKQLIQSILQTDPCRRPTIEDIMRHDFIRFQGDIPQFMPVSTLACPPSSTFLRQFTRKNSIAMEPIKKYERISSSELQLQPPSQNQQSQNNFLKERKDFNNLNTNRERAPSANANNIKTNTNEHSNNNLKFNLQTNPSLVQFSQPNAVDDKLSSPDVWVSKWVDYSSKYGLGYLLSNGSSGVCFNDSTKIVSTPDQQEFEYCERNNQDKQETIQKYSVSSYPSELTKKVTLLQHFSSYLEEDAALRNKQLQKHHKLNQGTSPNNMVYVKKWLKTKHACIFRLSNKVVQVIFSDQTEILLSSELRVVTYVNKKQIRLNFPLASALESTNAEMTKRLKYTKDILTQMLGNTAAQPLLDVVNVMPSARCSTYNGANGNYNKAQNNLKEQSKSPSRPMTIGSTSTGQFSKTGSYFNLNNRKQEQQQINQLVQNKEPQQSTFMKSQTLTRIGSQQDSKQLF